MSEKSIKPMYTPQLGRYVDVKTTQFTSPQKVVYAGTPKQEKTKADWFGQGFSPGALATLQNVDYATLEKSVMDKHTIAQEPINEFSGDYAFLSNFYPCEIAYEDLVYPSVEHAFQAAKTTNVLHRIDILNAPTPGKAERMGRKLELRPHWESLKLIVMHNLLTTKFKNPELRAKLHATGTKELVEGNHWGDTYWGVCNRQGLNHLGKTLARVRAELPYIVNHDYFSTARQNVYNDEVVDYAAMDAAMTHALYKKLEHDMNIADAKFKEVVDAATWATITTLKVREDK